jgi:hypothetical protein
MMSIKRTTIALSAPSLSLQRNACANFGWPSEKLE